MLTPTRLLCVSASLAALAAGTSSQCEVQKLVPLDSTLGQQTGEAVAIDGNVAVLGAPYDDDFGVISGAAYVYERQAGVWTMAAKLTASDAVADDRFGITVAVDQGVIVIGTRYKQDMGYGTGAAYVFERVGGAWTQTQKLLASDAQVGQFFAHSVAVSGSVILVGAYLDDELGLGAGAAYVFERIGGSWIETQRLTASDGTLDDRFGWAVAASGDVLFIGAHGNDDLGVQSGAAYVFQREGGLWVEKQKLLPSDPQELARFGYSLDVQDDWALVGCPFFAKGGTNQGAVYAYRLTGGSWTEMQRLTASDGQLDDLFGEQVALDGALGLVSAWGVDSEGIDAGAAYLFRNVGVSWKEKGKLTPSDVSLNDFFGKAVGVSEGTLLLGSPLDDDLGDRVGSAYLFNSTDENCPDLYAAPVVMRLVLGGTQYFTLLTSTAFAGDVYFMLGSLSGTAPGFTYGGFLLPLNPDAYFNLTLLHPNQPPLTASLGPLDAEGKGAAQLAIPAGLDPALTGVSVYHAYGILEPATYQLKFTSHPVRLTFL